MKSLYERDRAEKKDTITAGWGGYLNNNLVKHWQEGEQIQELLVLKQTHRVGKLKKILKGIRVKGRKRPRAVKGEGQDVTQMGRKLVSLPFLQHKKLIKGGGRGRRFS